MALIIILAVSLILRLAFMSPWLEDWDSVQFAMALKDFDISKNQPHAPGYVLYILLEKIIFFFTKNETLALTLLSVFSGTLLIVFVYLLTKKLFGQRTAIFASILILTLPIVWIMSEAALTNIVGLAALTAFTHLLVSSKSIFLPSFIGGFILGIRFTEIPIIAMFLVYSHIQKYNFKKLFLSIIIFFAGVLIWLIPTIILSSGLKESFSSYYWIANYVLTHDSTMGNRLDRLKYLLDISYTSPFLVLAIVSLFFMLFSRKKNPGIYLVLIWLISYLIPLAFTYNLEVPRYTLPLAIPFSICLAWFLTNKLPIKAGLITLILIIIPTFYQGLSQVVRYKTSLPPNISAVYFVRKNFDPKETLVLASYTYRQFQYYAPEFDSSYAETIDEERIKKYKLVVVDYLGLKDKLPKGYNSNIISQKSFTGDRDIFTRLPQVNIYALKLNNENEKAIK